MSNCPHCLAWHCHPADRFCGCCGTPLIEATVVVEPSILYKEKALPTNMMVSITPGRGTGGTKFLWHDQTGTHKDVEIGAFLPGEQIRKDFSTPCALLDLQSGVVHEWCVTQRVLQNKIIYRGELQYGIELPRLELVSNGVLLADGAETHISLRNVSGTDAHLTKMRLVSIGPNVPLPELRGGDAVTIRAGDTKALVLTLPKLLTDRLGHTPQGFQFALQAEMQGGATQEWRFGLRVKVPCKPTLECTHTEIAILRGRPLSLPLVLRNHGGEECHMHALNVSFLRGGSTIKCKPRTLGAAGVLAPVSARPYVLSVPVDCLPEGEGIYRVQITMDSSSGDPPSNTIGMTVSIRPIVPTSDIIAIDFGTTTTAAALYEHYGSPRSLRLGTKEVFIPTAIAYYVRDDGSLDYVIGEEALQMQSAISDKVAFFDNLKLRLDDPHPKMMPDHASERTWEEMARDYLLRVKALIENQVLKSVKDVCITRPARFQPHLAQALEDAYLGAGMSPRPIPVVPDNPLLPPHVSAQSESWPAATLCLTVDKLRVWQDQAVGPDPLLGGQVEDGQHKHGLLSYDVGGGSTDLSLMTLEFRDGMQLVKEIATEGGGNLCGNAISELIYQHLWPACERWLGQRGYDAAAMPITMPWARDDRRAVDSVAHRNGHRFAEVVYCIQRDSHINAWIYDFFNSFYQDGHNVWFRPEKPEATGNVRENIRLLLDKFDTWETQTRLVLPPLELTLSTVGGFEVALPINQPDQAPDPQHGWFDCGGFFVAFIDTISTPMFARLERMTKGLYSAESRNDPVIHAILSGRGALFLMVTNMVQAHLKELAKRQSQGKKKHPVHRVAEGQTKIFISAGAALLDGLLRVDNDVRFTPLPLPQFGFLDPNRKDSETGKSRFVPLYEGPPSPQEKAQGAPFPIAPRQARLSVLFYLIEGGRSWLEAEDVPICVAEGPIDLKGAQHEKAYIEVQPTEVGLTVTILAPRQGDTTEDRSQWIRSKLPCTCNQKYLQMVKP